MSNITPIPTSDQPINLFDPFLLIKDPRILDIEYRGSRRDLKNFKYRIAQEIENFYKFHNKNLSHALPELPKTFYSSDRIIIGTYLGQGTFQLTIDPERQFYKIYLEHFGDDAIWIDCEKKINIFRRILGITETYFTQKPRNFYD